MVWEYYPAGSTARYRAPPSARQDTGRRRLRSDGIALLTNTGWACPFGSPSESDAYWSVNTNKVRSIHAWSWQRANSQFQIKNCNKAAHGQATFSAMLLSSCPLAIAHNVADGSPSSTT
jgi:hypothetical protein